MFLMQAMLILMQKGTKNDDPTYSEMAIGPNQSGVSLQLSGIKLETVCNLFVISENCKYVDIHREIHT